MTLLLVLLTGSAVVHADTVLVQYGFDGTLPSAQEEFSIFEHSQGFKDPHHYLDPPCLVRTNQRE